MLLITVLLKCRESAMIESIDVCRDYEIKVCAHLYGLTVFIKLVRQYIYCIINTEN